MARQVLENGVILPAEYSDDWYDDMTSNLTKLDDVIGSDSEKLSSADVGAAALSNSYNDLDNLPTIPTVNDATLTIQKNGVDVQTFTANASSNVTANITVPTKTSDLTNDSNFVDTSNSAVASGITSAKVTSYDSHIADTDIHVTTADKTKWNNGVSQAFVFRYSSTALVASSTNSNTLLDNTDNLKVGDKVIDSNGVLFSVTAIDTANSTFTVGSALVDLALDANVVHTSGNETISGEKKFNDLQIVGYGTQYKGSRNAYILPEFSAGYSGLSITTLGFSQTVKIGNFVLDANNKPSLDTSKGYIQIATGESNGVNTCVLESRNSTSSFGTSANRWSKIYGTEYYYGSNNVEFSTKFVTTDTNQTISGVKTFSSSPLIYNSDTTASIPQITLKNQKVVKSSTTEGGAQLIYFTDKNNNVLGKIETRVISNGSTGINITSYGLDSNNQNISSGVQILRSPNTAHFAPNADNAVICGRALAKWSDVVTYKVNGLEPSSLGMPSDRSARIDISSYITNLGNGNVSVYAVPANGYIWLHFTSINSALCYSQTSSRLTNYAQTFVRYQGDDQLYAFFPVRKDDIFVVQIYTSSTAVVQNAYFIPCQGNI